MMHLWPGCPMSWRQNHKPYFKNHAFMEVSTHSFGFHLPNTYLMQVSAEYGFLQNYVIKVNGVPRPSFRILNNWRPFIKLLLNWAGFVYFIKSIFQEYQNEHYLLCYPVGWGLDWFVEMDSLKGQVSFKSTLLLVSMILTTELISFLTLSHVTANVP